MPEPEKDKEAANKTEDWAILPFDEAEDDARWTRLIEETDKLIEEMKEAGKLYGVLLTENKLNDFITSEKETEDELF